MEKHQKYFDVAKSIFDMVEKGQLYATTSIETGKTAKLIRKYLGDNAAGMVYYSYKMINGVVYYEY